MRRAAPRSRSSTVTTALIAGFLGALALASCHRPPESTEPCPPVSAAPAPDFCQEVTERSPALKEFVCRNGEDKGHYTLLEMLGGGVGIIDYDGDGLLDLVLVGGGDFAGPDGKDIVGYPTRV